MWKGLRSLAHEQALWLRKEGRKQRARVSERRDGEGWGRKEGEREGPPCPLPQSTFSSLIYFHAFPQLWSLFTG